MGICWLWDEAASKQLITLYSNSLCFPIHAYSTVTYGKQFLIQVQAFIHYPQRPTYSTLKQRGDERGIKKKQGEKKEKKEEEREKKLKKIYPLNEKIKQTEA